MGARTQRNRPRNQRERSLVPVEKDRFEMSANATSKATVTRGGQGINRSSNREAL